MPGSEAPAMAGAGGGALAQATVRGAGSARRVMEERTWIYNSGRRAGGGERELQLPHDRVARQRGGAEAAAAVPAQEPKNLAAALPARSAAAARRSGGAVVGAPPHGSTSLNDALSEGLSPNSDWAARVAAFNFIQILLQQGQKGIQDITQNFEKVMKLFLRYLDDPHHKVAQAAFSTLADVIPAFKKHFESYVGRILPYFFSRLVNPKELVRQQCSSTLDIVGRTYSIDTLLPALVRSLDEQRSPKAKLAVLEFASKSFDNYTVGSEGYSNSGFLKLWLTKLAPLIHEKNAKLKEASISGIISVYSHFYSAAVLNFILSLSIDEKNIVRRALKQYTPRIEVDLVNYLQNKKERSRPKSYDRVDSSTSSKDGYALTLKKTFPFGRFSDSLLDTESGKKMNTVQGAALHIVPISRTTSDVCFVHAKQCFERASEAEVLVQSRELKNNSRTVVEAVHSWEHYPEKSDATMDDENSTGTTRLDSVHLPSDGRNSVLAISEEHTQEGDPFVDLSPVNIVPHANNGPSVPQLLHQIGSGGEISTLDKREALQQLVRASTDKDNFIWTKYFNQILTTALEVLDDVDSSVRENSLLLVAEMLHNQKDSVVESIEIVLEKLLHVTKDDDAKIIAPFLASADEKTLVMCINCLTKLVGRLSQDELVTQLPSFLPAVFDAFNNQSPDVRKAVVFCLVDIHIILGKAFVPYLEGLSSTQLRLVTIYANRISQASSGAPVDANQ
ncbi:CLIP-associated protein-like isoform X1 [Panicum miliaceum]|uniref:CLIP-associated protein-like isoform X1 n=1 Tax=Panicum miliaceum TaxID=4540 RepID=A0A3L6QCC6_PANMI|nr:CLIP-associated protein-like isoform X1 [Panicum miliaceum]